MPSNIPQINTIVFDLHEVLISGVKDSKVELCQNLDIDLPTFNKLANDFYRGEIAEADLWRILTDGNSEKTEIAMRFVREKFLWLDGAEDILRRLKGNGYKLVLLSNHAKEWRDFVHEKLRFDNYFDDLIYSCDVGLFKPDPRIYELLIERLTGYKENTILIDDDERNIEAATSLGIKSLLFVNNEKLLRDLAEVDIEL